MPGLLIEALEDCGVAGAGTIARQFAHRRDSGASPAPRRDPRISRMCRYKVHLDPSDRRGNGTEIHRRRAATAVMRPLRRVTGVNLS
jgi:hypothetical protein